MNLFIVMKFVAGKPGESNEWEFQGVFDSAEKAVAQCKDRNYFVGPAVLNKEIGEERSEWEGLRWPIQELEQRSQQPERKLTGIG